MHLKELRKNRNMTQEELANQFDVARATISAWETGKVVIPLSQKEKIADFFNVPIEDIVFSKEKENHLENNDNLKYLDRLYKSINEFASVLDSVLDEENKKELNDAITDVIRRMTLFTEEALNYAKRGYQQNAVVVEEMRLRSSLSLLHYQESIYESLRDYFDDTLTGIITEQIYENVLKENNDFAFRYRQMLLDKFKDSEEV